MDIVKDKISVLQLTRSKVIKNEMFDANHWHTLGMVNPDIFMPANMEMFGAMAAIGHLNPLDMLKRITGSKVKETVGDTWRWPQKVGSYIPMRIKKVLTTTDKPGYLGSEIRIIFDHDLAVKMQIVSPGAQAKNQALVVKEKRTVAEGIEYTLTTYDSDEKVFIEAKHLKVGTPWLPQTVLRGEAAETGGFTTDTTPIMFENYIARSRMQYQVTDDGATLGSDDMRFPGFSDAYIVSYTDGTIKPNGKPKVSTAWMKGIEMKNMLALNKALVWYSLYGRLGNSNLRDPDSKKPIKTGAGLEQQSENGGFTRYYNTLTAEHINSYFGDVASSRLGAGSLGNVVGYTGWYGMLEFHEAMQDYANQSGFKLNSESFIWAVDSDYHEKGQAIGYQYTRYYLPNGGTLRLVRSEFNDDRTWHSETAAKNPKATMQSYRIMLMDVTGASGMDNMCLVKKKNGTGVSVVAGTINPDGSNNKNPAHPGAYYEVVMRDTLGVHVFDTTRMGNFILNN